MNAYWTTQEAIDLCIQLEEIAPDFGAHIGLTGGLLYKQGKRKDADIIIYRIRQAAAIDEQGLFDAFELVGVRRVSGMGWCHKATYKGKAIDFFFPEEDGEYDPQHASLVSEADLNDICDYAYLEDGECVESAWHQYATEREVAQKVAA